MSDHYADHQPRPVGPTRTWRTRPQGVGRYVALERPLGVPAGVLWTNDTDAIGFYAYDGETPADLALQIAMGVQAAYATAGSTPERVFDHWAGQATANTAAGPVQATGDLAAAITYVADHQDTPPIQ